ncbi:amino acid ABC transporter permease [Amycolatopsis sacchari]|uniref:Polar amino acid transport system permease protein n=1 Tax=Amycolatopsis sacchari TaxID=115433 RepID=A0A1I3R964_9PSEU|nr:amino acid ABC transporter permease [Amycolatopsis sacchari]SFJ43143.1 polar amino acid transport system permease protein [Amycolatopsis sacchari]
MSTVDETVTVAAPGEDVASARGRLRPLRWLFVLVLAVLAAQLVLFLVRNERFQWDVVAKYLFEKSVMAGLGTTVVLAIAAMALGSLIGGVVAAMQLSGFAPARWVATLWVGLFRGIPPLVQLIFWFNLAYLLPKLSIGIPFGPVFGSWDANTVITPLTAAVIGLSLVESAYLAEIFRAGMGAVDPGQRDAARAMGYPPAQTLLRIVLPQAMRVIVPPAGSQFINVLKGTALVSVIAMSDLLHSVQVIYNRTYEIVPMLLVACFWYLVVVTALTAGQRWLERRFSRGHRPVAVRRSR